MSAQQERVIVDSEVRQRPIVKRGSIARRTRANFAANFLPDSEGSTLIESAVSKSDTAQGRHTAEPEVSPYKEGEKWATHFAALIFSGRPGAGSSSLARNIARKYGKEVRKSLGEEYRAESNKPIIGDVRLAPEIDREFDKILVQQIKNATPENPVIRDAKYGGLFATELMYRANYNPEQIIVTVWVDAKTNERARRIKRREEEKARREEKEFTKTVQEVKKDTQERVRGLLEKLGDLYPGYRGIDLFVAHALDQKGRKIYQIHMSTTHLIEEETLEALHRELLRIGVVEPYRNGPKPTSPPEETVSETV